MLDILLKTTTLTELAFQPKPKNIDFLQHSDEFWQKRYRNLNSLQIALHSKDSKLYTELNQLFDNLIHITSILGISSNLLQKTLNSLGGLQERCHSHYFNDYIKEIKNQLEIITFFLFTSHYTEKKVAIISLLTEANVCPEGCFLKLQQIIYLLNDKTSLFNWLANLRLDIIRRFFANQHDQSAHHLNAILNYAQEIGLNIMDDDITYHQLKKDQYILPLEKNEKEKFKQFFCSQYTIQTIIDYVTEQLQSELNLRLREFQSEIPPFGLVISDQINPYHIENKLRDLPINQSHQLLNPISEDDDSYYQVKSIQELKQDLAYHLLEIGVLKKQTKPFRFKETDWEFTIIEGDYDGDYGFILKNTHSQNEEKLPLFAFEENKLYQHFSLEAFHKNKTFLVLGQQAFNYFYQKKANFSHCHLVDIDFRHLDKKFLASLYGPNDSDADFIRAKLTYEQLMNFYKLKKYSALHNSYLVTMANAKQFFNIIMEIIGNNIKERHLFLERHKEILVENKLYNEIISYLDNEIEKNKKNRIKTIKKMNDFDNYEIFLLFLEPPFFIFSMVILGMCGFYYLPFIYCGLGLLFSTVLIPIAIIMLEDLKEKLLNNPFNYQGKIDKLRKEEKELLSLEEQIIQFSHKQEEKTENQEHEATADITDSPTSISTYLLHGQKIPTKGINEEEVASNRCASFAVHPI